MYFKGNLPFQGGFFISEMQLILCYFSSQMWQHWGIRLTLKREGLWKHWGRAGAPGTCLTTRRGSGWGNECPSVQQRETRTQGPTALQSLCQRCRECCQPGAEGTGTSSREQGSLLPGEQVSFLPSSQGSHSCQKTCFQMSSLRNRK